MEVGQGKVRRVVTGHDKSGKAIVLTDEQPAVRTNHAWSNRSGKPCRMLFVLIDGKFDAELAEKFRAEAH